MVINGQTARTWLMGPDRNLTQERNKKFGFETFRVYFFTNIVIFM
ncbi:hypothetical protein METP3_03841 [Methanosarcinales archaeon]|nr:hypothetical protein METP3_03841 [Methanosarcinales archaeon]